MVYGDPYEGFQKIPRIAILISRQWNLLFHLLPRCLLFLVTLFDMFSVHGNELNCGCVILKTPIMFF